MRRLRQTRVKPFFFKPKIVTKDNEGVPEISYGDHFVLKGELWPATSKRQIEQYGDRIENIANMRVEGKYRIVLMAGSVQANFSDGSILRPGDGVYVYADLDGRPDYAVLSITQYYPLKLEVERIV